MPSFSKTIDDFDLFSMSVLFKILCLEIIRILSDLVTTEDILFSCGNCILRPLYKLAFIPNEESVFLFSDKHILAASCLKSGLPSLLASKVSSMISADSLVLLTDTDGLFDQNPKDNTSAKLIATISEDKFDRRVLRDSKKNISFGGMTSKIDAALNVSKYGIPTIIANGMKAKIIDKIFKYENVGTMIIPNIRTVKSRKQWIGMGLKTAGKLLLDDGAIDAIISKGKSLLPSGIQSIEGRFAKGQQVECVSISTGKSIARGLTSYSSDELEKIRGKKSNQIISILGYKYSDEVINRDNMIVEKN